MDETRPQVQPEELQPVSGAPKIGVDEWVAEAEERDVRYRGRIGRLRRRWDAIPAPARFAALVVVAAIFPVLTSNDYYVRAFGFNTLLYAMLALGLNIVVGWAGLLDLGYVAFYGLGAYAYALLSSNQFHLHWPAYESIPLIVAGVAFTGWLLGHSSRRLLGDYLAIVTLSFGEIFLNVVNNANRITLPGHSAPTDFTGGPNGISPVDTLDFRVFVLNSLDDYYYYALIVFVVLMAMLFSLDRSRIGRSWRSLREDPLAAQLMGMPINKLKLAAFGFGAGVAAFSGTVLASLQDGVFPGNFDLQLLILIYAMVILGGAGSLPGVIAGVLTLNFAWELLRTPDNARWVFYVLLAGGLALIVRPALRLAAVVAATIALGFVVTALAPGTTSNATGSGGLASAIDHWVPLFNDPRGVGNACYAGLIAAVLLLVQVRGRWRTVLLPAVVYLACLTWENRLVFDPSVARLVFLGALLVALVIVRPQGLLGTARVEIS